MIFRIPLLTQVWREKLTFGMMEENSKVSQIYGYFALITLKMARIRITHFGNQMIE